MYVFVCVRVVAPTTSLSLPTLPSSHHRGNEVPLAINQSMVDNAVKPGQVRVSVDPPDDEAVAAARFWRAGPFVCVASVLLSMVGVVMALGSCFVTTGFYIFTVGIVFGAGRITLNYRYDAKTALHLRPRWMFNFCLFVVVSFALFLTWSCHMHGSVDRPNGPAHPSADATIATLSMILLDLTNTY